MKVKFINFLKFIFSPFLKVINKLRELENKEVDVLIKNMPSWYVKYQYNFFSRLLRLCALIVIASTWYLPMIEKLCQVLNLNLLFKIISSEEFLSIYGILFIICVIFLFCHCIFSMAIRIIFFKKIVRNSPISIAQCISTGFRICRYGAYGVGLFVGIPGIDYAFERNGHIPPFRGYYMKHHISYFGANNINCAITDGDQLPKEGIIKTFISNQQEYTIERENIANKMYQSSKMEGCDSQLITDRVVDALER